MALNQDIDIIHLPIGDLCPYAANPRPISDHELESVTRSIREFGFVDPVIDRREDKVVIGGHQRLVAARKLGLKRVPVVLVDVSEDQARLLNIALNRISGWWDQELLAPLLAELNDIPEVDLSLSGFSDDELQKHLKTLDSRDKKERPETFDLDEATEAARASTVAHTGDVWLLGHRIMCGDSTDSPTWRACWMGRKPTWWSPTHPTTCLTGSTAVPQKPVAKGPSKTTTWGKAFTTFC